MANKKHNVLIIMSDQHSKRQLGCYGDGLVRTPNLDRLARDGMLFENAYTPSPLCVPARSSFMTSRTPTNNRVWTNQQVLSSGIPTWAHSLGAGGYETALLGRMHFVGPDQRHGFEKRPLGEYMAHLPGASMLGAPMFKKIPSSTTGQDRIALEMAGYGATSYHRCDEMVTDAACLYLNEMAAGSDERPFAAVVGFMMPHSPYFADKELFDYYYERVDVPQPTPEELAREPEPIKTFKRLRRLDEPLSAERIRVARAAYYGMCEFVDQQTGRILEMLDTTGLAENTLVIYTTDHGEMAGAHGCWWKSNYYEQSVGIPLIARLPGVVAAGIRNPAICNTIDLGPTLIEMTGADTLPQSDGSSLWKELLGERDDTRPDETFSEFLGRWGDAPSRMVRRGAWKLYKYGGDAAPALFNLEDDPEEMNDLGSDPQHEAIRDELLQRVYDGWDPEHVLRETAASSKDMALLTEWGKVVQPRLDETLAVPEDAEDITLL